MGFYSALKEAAANLAQNKGTGEQFLKMLQKQPGVKPEEVSYYGLDKVLPEQGKMNSQKLLDILDSQSVEPENHFLPGRDQVRRNVESGYPPPRLEAAESGGASAEASHVNVNT